MRIWHNQNFTIRVEEREEETCKIFRNYFPKKDRPCLRRTIPISIGNYAFFVREKSRAIQWLFVKLNLRCTFRNMHRMYIYSKQQCGQCIFDIRDSMNNWRKVKNKKSDKKNTTDFSNLPTSSIEKIQRTL